MQSTSYFAFYSLLQIVIPLSYPFQDQIAPEHKGTVGMLTSPRWPGLLALPFVKLNADEAIERLVSSVS